MARSPRPLDLDAWGRRGHFEFFRRYDLPYFNVCAEVAVGPAVRRAREPGAASYFARTMHASLGAANEVEEFRYRIRGDGVVVHDVVHGGSTALRPDGTFAFAYFDYATDLDRFARSVATALEELARGDRTLDPRDDRDDLIHHSVIPWIAFTSVSHARRRNPEDSVPKVTFGRFHGPPGEERMPVSVEVHHALMDGLHVARYLQILERRLAGEAAGGA